MFWTLFKNAVVVKLRTFMLWQNAEKYVIDGVENVVIINVVVT